MLAHYHGSAPTKADLKLPTWPHQTWSWKGVPHCGSGTLMDWAEGHLSSNCTQRGAEINPCSREAISKKSLWGVSKVSLEANNRASPEDARHTGEHSQGGAWPWLSHGGMGQPRVTRSWPPGTCCALGTWLHHGNLVDCSFESFHVFQRAVQELNVRSGSLGVESHCSAD